MPRPRRKPARRKKVTEVVETAERLPFHKLIHTLDVGVAAISPTGELLFANHAFKTIFSIGSLLPSRGSNLKRFMTPGSWNCFDEAMTQVLDKPVTGQVQILNSHGVQTVRLSFNLISDHPEKIIQIQTTEITELMEKAQALSRSEASLSVLSARILRLQDEERRRIARDLHDVTGQELAVLSMSLSELEQKVDSPETNIRESLQKAIEYVRGVASGVRTVSYLLHPPLLDEMGLGPALQWYVDGFEKRSGIQVKSSIAEDAPRLNRDSEIALFRVAQESLTNALRHSGTPTARVAYAASAESVRLFVEDDGRGMDPTVLLAANEGFGKLGVGISGMRERLIQLGGTLKVVPRKHGIRVVATLPLSMVKKEESAASPGTDQQIEGQDSPKGNSLKRKRILVADDHDVVRQGIKLLLSTEKEWEVCGEARNGAEAVEKAKELLPDLILLDLTMPGFGGLTAARQIRDMKLPCRILVFTDHFYGGLLRMLEAAGCEGYVRKSMESRDLIRGIRQVLGGGKFFDGEVAEIRSA